MSNDLMLDVGQANELKLAFRRAGYSNDEIKQLCEGNTLADVRNVLLGCAEIKAMEHVINCDTDPFVPSGWRVEKHEKSGSFRWDPKQVQFYLSKSQKKDGSIVGNKLRTELADKPVLNANVLEYLLAHPHLIPEAWKEETNGDTTCVFFWGTIYCDSDGDLCIRCLFWDGDGWYWDCGWLDDVWSNDYPAALRAPQSSATGQAS